MKKTKILILFSVVLLFLDRLSKWFILNYPDLYYSRIIEFRLVKNFNFYFFSVNQLLLTAIIGVIILFFLLLLLKTKNIGLLLIILGGASNFFDRIYYGYVVDWIRVFVFPLSVFNIADLMIIIGIICLIFSLKKSR